MYDVYIMRRTQIYLEPSQMDALAQRARGRATTSSHLIREAVDRYLATPDPEDDRLARFRAALDQSFGVAPHLPPGDEYVRELREADRAREQALEHRRRS
jgi:Arc/MetJ-type ribon-helix-helix transcriptional regulator